MLRWLGHHVLGPLFSVVLKLLPKRWRKAIEDALAGSFGDP